MYPSEHYIRENIVEIWSSFAAIRQTALHIVKSDRRITVAEKSAFEVRKTVLYIEIYSIFQLTLSNKY